MKILFVTPDMFVGGAGKQLSIVASGLLGKNHDIFLYTYLGNNLEHRIDNRIVYIPEENVRKSRIGYFFTTPINIRRVVKKIKPDLIIAWRSHAGGFSVMGCVGLRVKIIFSERNDPFVETTPALKVLTRVCCFADGGVFQTKKIRSYYKMLGKAAICPNPLPPNFEIQDVVPIENKNKEIAWVGRLVNSHKRMDVAINAFRLIHEKFPDYKLVFWGDGKDLVFSKKIAEDLNLSNNIEFKGVSKNVISDLRHARLFILTSDYEGIPNVVLESFAAGTPVVATDSNSGGVRLLIEDGKNGYYVNCGDYEALAHKAINLLEDNSLSKRFVELSREKLNDFNFHSIIDKWEHFIEEVTIRR